MAIGSCFFVCLGFWIIDDPDFSEVDYLGEFAPIIGWAAIIFFGICAIVLLIQYFKQFSSPVPGFEIDDDSFSGVHTALGKLHKVPFDCVDRFSLYNDNALVVHYNDRGKHERHGVISKATVKSQAALTGGDEVFVLTGMKMGPAEICSLLNESFTKWKNQS